MSNKINKSHLIVIVAVFCLIISGCSGGTVEDISPVDFSDTPTPIPTPVLTPTTTPVPPTSLDTTESMSQDLPDCETLYGAIGYWDNCQGTMTYTNGDTYVVGVTVLTHTNGDRYVGEFKDNMKHGQGTMTYADGNQYVGEWKDDKYHGQGTLTTTGGDQYVGEFKDGAFDPDGHGTLTYADGSQVIR